MLSKCYIMATSAVEITSIWIGLIRTDIGQKRTNILPIFDLEFRAILEEGNVDVQNVIIN